jgi:cytochrome c
MIKTATLLFLTASLFGANGYKVYQENCKSCHIEMISKTETLKIFKTLKAPPMVEVSKQLKNNIMIGDDDEDVHRFTVVSFIKAYVKKPSLDYSMCNPGAIERFGIMPAQSQLSEEERQAVAEWIYDRYEGVEFK